jgi:hypothetical protein
MEDNIKLNLKEVGLEDLNWRSSSGESQTAGLK